MINSKFLILIFILQILLVTSAYSQNSFFQKSPNRFNYGDSINWKDPNYDVSSWPILYSDFIDYQNEYCWIITDIYLSTNEYDYKDLVLLLDITANYEVYWNGVKLGQNFIGDIETINSSGIFSKTYSFSDSLEYLAKNKLAIRAKVANNEILEFGYMAIADPLEIKMTEYYVYGYLILLMILYSVIIFLYLTYFKKHSSFLITSYLLFTLILMLISLLIDFLLFAGYSGYYLIHFSKSVIDVLIYLVLFSFSIFFLEFGKIKSRNLYMAAIGLLLITSYLFELDRTYYLIFGFTPPLLLIYFYYEKKTFIKVYSTIFIIIIIVFLNAGFNISIINLPFIIFFFYLSLVYLQNENLKKAEMYLSTLRATRLETEMLKKIIQPHYIMNSLNAVIEWIEEEPKEGLKFIKGLSDEFRSFSNFSNRKSISIKEELKLCKNHLKIMEYRHHRKYIFNTKINDLSKQIPPAIIHTIIENGIAHHPLNYKYINFNIESNSSSDSLELKVITNYVNENDSIPSFSEDSIIIDKSKENIIEGNGFKYIRSRLSESYGDNWELNYYGNESAWVTIIKIFTKEQ